MGIHDFDAIFEQLDSLQRGYLTAKQIQQFHSSISDNNTDETLVQISVENICGKGCDKVTKDSFLAVLDELERRRTTDTEAYWDFQALDYNGNNLISLTDALLLFQEYHGDHFSLDTWHRFLQSREKPDGDVYFDEIRDWLCDIPYQCQPSTHRQVKREEARVEHLSGDAAYKDLVEMRKLFTNDDLDRAEQDERKEHIHHHSRKKLNKWKTHGLGAMLNDDGLGTADDDTDLTSAEPSKDMVRTSDVIDALDSKYSMLQDKIIMEMAAYAANMDSEKSEIFQQTKRSLAKLTKDKALSEKIDDLPGSQVTLPMTLFGMLGDLSGAEQGRKEEFKELLGRLEYEGLNDAEIDIVLAENYKKLTDGQQTCGKALVQLHLRHKAERNSVLTSLHKSKGSLPSSALLALHYWGLLRQLHLLQEEPLFTQAGLAVGLGERTQTYKPKRFDWDQQRSEILAGRRLEARRGHKPVKRSTAAPDLDSLQGMGLVALKVRLVQEMENRHYLEREALIYMLQGHDSRASMETAAKMSFNDRKHRQRTLRSQREEWKRTSNPDSSANTRLVQEAVGLYCEEKRAELETKNHNVREESVLAAVLADVQQKQAVEFHTFMGDIHMKNATDLKKLVLEEIEATKDEYFSNIAYVVLGCVDISEDDAEYLKALEGKYAALRDQILVFGLMEKMGSEWKSLHKEEKEKELLKQRKEEKRLRGEGLLGQMSALIGPRSQALVSLYSLIGEDRAYENVSPRPTDIDSSTNLLADLVPRCDQEREALLSWLSKEQTKKIRRKVKHVHVAHMAAEKFGASSEGDHETALLYTGLLERIRDALTGRSKSDKDRQLNLAQKRALLRTKCVKHGEKLHQPKQEKEKPKDDDEEGLQAVLLRTMMRRHYKEREIMLSLLQDNGLDELVEAAALMSPDQAMKSVQELKAKRDNLDLDNEATIEEHTFILEEVGAIRAAGKKQAMCKSLGKAVLISDVIAHLLAELQDLQDVELASALNKLPLMTAPDMLQQISQDEKAKKNSHCHLLMKVFAKLDGDTSGIEFDKLIAEKYSMLRNHLIHECAAQQQGKQTWAKMNQKQKNKAVSALATREASMWNEGNSESMSACLFPGFFLKPSIPYLMGVGRQQYFLAVPSADSQVILEDGAAVTDSGGPETISFLHKRFMAEVDFVTNFVGGSMDFVPSDDDKQLLMNKLKWEILLSQSAQDFTTAGLVTGLAERQHADQTNRLQNDPNRYELLAKKVVSSKREQVKKPALDVVNVDDINKMQEGVMAILNKKHVDEWNVLCQLMSSSRFKDVQQLASVETWQQRADRLIVLENMRKNLNFTATSDHMTILEEAVAVKKECLRHDLSNGDRESEVTDNDVEVSLMSQLLQAQMSEAQVYLEAFAAEGKEDLQENQMTIVTEISQSHVTNVAEVVFKESDTAEETEEQEKVKEAVDGKYDALRDKLLMQALIDEMGEAEWRRLSEKERQRLLMELKLKERQLRWQGKYDEANALLGELLNNDEKLRKLLGNEKERQAQLLRERLERRKQRLAEGMTEEECDALEEEEIAKEEEEEEKKRRNVLLYLDQCHDKEKEDLMRRLAEMSDEHEKQRLRQLEMLRLRRDERRLRDEDKLGSAAMLMSLCEDNDRRSKLSEEEEKKRQQELARQRLEMARLKRLQGDNLVRGEIILNMNQEDDSKSGDTVLKLLDKRHQNERNLFIKLLDEGSEEEARDEARVMTDDELKTRLEEVQELYNIWRESDTREIADGEKILAGAVPLCIEAKKRDLLADGEMGSDEDVKVALVADLQMLQDGEAAHMLQLLMDADDDQKKQILQNQQRNLQNNTHDNVAKILLALANEEDIFVETKEEEGGEVSKEEKEDEKKVVNALEKKYDAMRDKLLLEALMYQFGEAEWARLSELERQKKLTKMKREERRLRREGKLDEVAALLGNFMDNTKEIDRLMGQTASDQKRRIQEKLELRKKLRQQREAEGLAVDEETMDEIVEEEEKKIGRKNIQENLDNQFEEEKAAILARLRSHNNQFVKERERQLALAKLQREQRRLKQEEKFETAAMIFALGQEAGEKKQQNLLSEQERQRQLAKDRVEAMKKKLAAGKGQEDPTETTAVTEEEAASADITDNVVLLQDSILASTEKHQADERDALLTLISKYTRDPSKNKAFANTSEQDLRLGLAKLQREYEAWEKKVTKSMGDMNMSRLPPKKKLKIQNEAMKRRKEQLQIFEMALQHKFELERRLLLAQHEELEEKAVFDELSVSALTDLQEKQMGHLLSVQDLIREKTVDELSEIRRMQRSVSREGWFKTLSTSIFTVSDMLGELHSKDDMEKKLAGEFDKQKQEIIARSQREAIDVDSMLKDIENQYEARRKVLRSDRERQAEMLKQRLAARKQMAEDKEWDATLLASQIFAANGANVAAAKQAKEGEKGRQNNLLQQRLQARREARKHALEKANEDRPASRASIGTIQSGQLSRQGTFDGQPPVFGLSREKTVVDVHVSDDQKQATYQQLVKQEMARQQKISAQQLRQEDLLKQKILNRNARRENEAASLVSLGERQKTILQQSQKDERDRQIAQMKERMTRMRESRSRSPANKAAEKETKK